MSEKKLLTAVLVSLAAVIVVALGVIPVILIEEGTFPDDMLNRLSDLGQAYGIMSAFLAVLAFAAVAVSVRIQARQNGFAARNTWQGAHFQIFKMVIDDPDLYGPCFGNLHAEMGRDQFRRYLFTSVFLNFLMAADDADALPPARPKSNSGAQAEIFGGMFTSEIARELWRIRRREMMETYGSMDALGPIYATADDMYERAMAGLNTRAPGPGEADGPGTRPDEERR